MGLGPPRVPCMCGGENMWCGVSLFVVSLFVVSFCGVSLCGVSLRCFSVVPFCGASLRCLSVVWDLRPSAPPPDGGGRVALRDLVRECRREAAAQQP